LGYRPIVLKNIWKKIYILQTILGVIVVMWLLDNLDNKKKKIANLEYRVNALENKNRDDDNCVN